MDMMTRRRVMMGAASAEKPRLYIYNLGDECTDITGGWEVKGYQKTPSGNFITKNSNNLAMGRNNTSTGPLARTFSTKNKIDLSAYSKIYFEFEMNKTTGTTNSWFYFPVNLSAANTNTGAFGSDATSRRVYIYGDTKERTTLSRNLPALALSTPVYVSFNLDSWDSPKQHEIKLFAAYFE